MCFSAHTAWYIRRDLFAYFALWKGMLPGTSRTEPSQLVRLFDQWTRVLEKRLLYRRVDSFWLGNIGVHEFLINQDCKPNVANSDSWEWYWVDPIYRKVRGYSARRIGTHHQTRWGRFLRKVLETQLLNACLWEHQLVDLAYLDNAKEMDDATNVFRESLWRKRVFCLLVQRLLHR